MVYKNETGIKLKTIKQGDNDFYFSHDGFHLVPRAAFQISSACPENYKHVIQECINYGWLKTIAHMKESEYVWEKLGE